MQHRSDAVGSPTDKGRLTVDNGIVYRFAMKHHLRNSWLAPLLVLLALTSVLLAPVVSISHAGQASQPPAIGDQHHGDCGDHQSQTDDDDCCASSACSCACHAPLLTSLSFPPPPLVMFEHAWEPAQQLPTVYLSIFVPPQNIS